MEKIKAKVEQVLHKDKDTTATGTHRTHAGAHTGTTGTHTGTHGVGHSDPTGPHDSRLGNKVDPRVDSDHVGSYGNTTSQGLTGNSHAGHTGGGLTGNTYGSDPTGPHDSRLGNKVDPRVDSDHVGGYGNTNAGQGLTGQTHSGHTGGGLTGNTYGSDPTGPHDSKLANKLDPRVDSDHVGSYGNTTTGQGLTGNSHAGHTGGGLTGNTYGSDPTGPHDSKLANKLDPRVDSDHAGGYGNAPSAGGYSSNTHTGGLGHSGDRNPTHIGSTGHTGGLTGSTAHTGITGNHHSDPTGPHDSHLANRVDPRVDSDHIGSYGNTTEGLTGNTHSAHTGGGLAGTTHTSAGHGLTGQGSHLPGPAPGTAGPHKSDLLNKADPRVDADLDGSKTYGGNKTYGN